MNKNKVLNKINKLIQEGNNLLENKEYYDLNHNSKETGVLMLLPNSCGYKVDEENFSKWESEINVFLSSNKKFTASLSDFKKSKLRETSEDTTKRYISILEGLKNNIEDDTIEFEDSSTSFEKKQNSIFIGHGRSNLWNEVVRMLKDDCELDCINYFEKETHAGKFIGDRQLEAMLNLGINERDIFVDKYSGKNFDRPQYQALKVQLRESVVLVIKSLDRLGRKYKQICEEWREITREIKANIKVLDMPF